MINIHYRGIPVYLQQVHAEDGTATVFPLDNMDHVQVVELSGLVEMDSYLNNLEGFTMDKQRADEIAQSPDMKRVTYNGQSVYIQRVNEDNNTARIFPLEDPQNEFDVQLSDLVEE